MILVSRESVSSYTSATFIRSEKANDLLEGIISLLLPLHPSEGPITTVCVDPAPGFQTLSNNQPLKNKGIIFELGRLKNPNKNPVADKAIQELESEILRLEPTESPITSTQLNLATHRLNSRIRFRGLSSYELMFRRNQFTAGHLNNPDEEIIASQHKARVQNHPYSHKSQQPKSSSRSYSNSTPLEGSIVYLYNEKSKHNARNPYLVVAKEGPWLKVQKLIKNQLRSRMYDIHCSECFTVEPRNINKPINYSSSSEDELEIVSKSHDTVSNKGTEAPTPNSVPVNTYYSPPEQISDNLTTEPTQITPMDGPDTFEEESYVPQSNKTIVQPSSSMNIDQLQRPQCIRKRPVYLDDYVTSGLPEKEDKEEEVTAPGC